jgi:hypothetical protein
LVVSKSRLSPATLTATETATRLRTVPGSRSLTSLRQPKPSAPQPTSPPIGASLRHSV